MPERLDDLARERVRRIVARAALVVVRRAQLNLTGPILRVRTGRLRASLVSRVEPHGRSWQARVGTPVRYGRVHEFGATIVPRRARVLRFEVEGQRVFARRAVIPARRWLQRSMREAIPEIRRVLRDGGATP